MNAQNAHEYLPLVQALTDGKQLQVRFQPEYNWMDIPEFNGNESPECYRIKPEPRTFELIRSKRTGVTYSVEEWGSAMPAGKQADLWERITVQEVLA